MWRAQLKAFADQGWRCDRARHARLRRILGAGCRGGVCPGRDRGGYGRTSRSPRGAGGHLGRARSGKPGGRGACRASPGTRPGRGPCVRSLFAGELSLASLVPLVDRKLIPPTTIPTGSGITTDFYLTHFDQTVADFNADIPATLSVIYRRGNPKAVGKVYPSATITSRAGWFRAGASSAAVALRHALWPPADFDALVAAFRATGFLSRATRGTSTTPPTSPHAQGARQRTPDTARAISSNGEWDAICDIAAPVSESPCTAPVRTFP